MKKKAGLWVSVFFIILAVLSFSRYLYQKDEDIYAEEVITKASGEFKIDLKTFLHNVNSVTETVKKDISHENVDKVSRDSLTAYFTQLIAKDRLLKGIILLGSKRNFVLLHDKNSWIVTHSFLRDTLIEWQRLDDQLQPISKWTDLYSYFIELEVLNSIKISYLKDGMNVWRTVQSKDPGYRDLLINIFKSETSEGEINIAMLMYKTGELGKRFANVLSFKEPLVTLITRKDDIITPIKTTDTAKIAKSTELVNKVKSNIKTWQIKHNEQTNVYQFEKFDSQYWTCIDTIHEQKVDIKAYALTLAETDLLAEATALNEAFLYASILFLLLALFVYLITHRNFYMHAKKTDPVNQQLSLEEMLDMIHKGETELVELKSSLRWDYRDEKVNKVLEDVILKSIAAFSNAKGGRLFIGVSDDMEILGLEADFNTLKKQNVDYFELHLRKLINNQFGIKFSNHYLHVQFQAIDGKTICVLHIHPADDPLYLKVKNNQGHWVEKFYVRTGNASQEITSLKEINEYINHRFH